MISEYKLKLLLQKLREKFDFDTEIVYKTIMETVQVRKILSHDELVELIERTINDYFHEKALRTIDVSTFNNDVYQQAGAMAVSLAKIDAQTIKEAFLELEKDLELVQLLEEKLKTASV